MGTIAWPAVAEGFKTFTAWVKGFVGTIAWPAVAEGFKTFTTWVKGFVGVIAWPAVAQGFKTFKEWAKGIIGTVDWGQVKTTITTAINGALRGLSDGKRSEEHTSELQSHSFNSYAVFFLKKKLLFFFSCATDTLPVQTSCS